MPGKAIRENRKEQGLSTSALAEKLGVSQGFVSQIECGKLTPSVDVLLKISDILHISVYELLKASGHVGAVLIQSDSAFKTIEPGGAEVSLLSPVVSREGISMPLEVFRISLAPQQKLHRKNRRPLTFCLFGESGSVCCRIRGQDIPLNRNDSISAADCWEYEIENTSGCAASVIYVLLPVSGVQESEGKSGQSTANAAETLGSRIKERRMQLKMSQEQLAEKADVTPPHISMIERNSTRPSLPVIRSIASALGVPTARLFMQSVESIHVTREKERQIFAFEGNCLSNEVLAPYWGKKDQGIPVLFLRQKGLSRETEFSTHTQIEYLCLLKGKINVYTADREEPYRLQVGDSLCTPPGLPHALENLDAEESQMLCVQCSI